MPIMTDWYDERRAVIRVKYSDPWTLDEFTEQCTECQRMMDSVHSHVDTVMEMSSVKRIPPGSLSKLPQLNRTALFTHPRRGIIVMVGGAAMAEMMWQILSGRSNTLLRVASMDEALNFNIQFLFHIANLFRACFSC